ncbi:MAG: alpha/beta-type small acid-soluble spore protein [Peptococcaceae bacterium]|nr:alpha/beta-type small acid-soluble spore protein [Peptococcaceae bacterium]
MSRQRGVMSEELKYNIAREMGVEKTVSSQGWGAVSAKDCGNMVTKAIEIASRSTDDRRTK